MLEESVGYTVFDGGAALSTDPMLVEVGLRNGGVDRWDGRGARIGAGRGG
jgi:hypothetical protein